MPSLQAAVVAVDKFPDCGLAAKLDEQWRRGQ